MRAALALALLTLAAPARAAVINYAKFLAPLGPSIIFVGPIMHGDLQKLAWAEASTPAPKTVMLNSMGGDIREALKIGDEIAARRFKTVVFPFSACASACALVWLAGSDRFLVQGGKVGFHGAWETHNGIKVESGPGNALIGAYLGRRELGPQAIEFATAATPDTANWITGPGFERYGIAYTYVTYDPKNEGAQGLLGRPPIATAKSDAGFPAPKKVDTSMIGRDGTVLLDGATKRDFMQRLLHGPGREPIRAEVKPLTPPNPAT